MRLMKRLALIMLAAASASPAEAGERRVESRTARIPRETLAELTRWGEVLLVEHPSDGNPGQAALFGRIAASPERVFAAVSDVSRYPEIIDTMTHIRVLDRDDGLLAYRWVATVPPLVRMDGVRLQRVRPPHLVEVRGHSGHLRGTRERFEIHPVEDETLIAMYRSLDVETGHLLLRTIAGIDPSMEQGLNLATLIIHFEGLREALVGETQDPNAPAAPGVAPLPVAPHLASIGPMLEHGTVVVIQSIQGGRVGQVMLTERVEAPAETVRSVIQQADRWPEFIDSLEYQRMTPRGENRFDLDWKIAIPLGALKGRSEMRLHPDGSITVDTISGDIASGQAHWRVHATSDESSYLVHHSYSDLRDAAWLLKALLEAEPHLEHGILGAAGTLAVSRVKSRAEEVVP